MIVNQKKIPDLFERKALIFDAFNRVIEDQVQKMSFVSKLNKELEKKYGHDLFKKETFVEDLLFFNLIFDRFYLKNFIDGFLPQLKECWKTIFIDEPTPFTELVTDLRLKNKYFRTWTFSKNHLFEKRKFFQVVLCDKLDDLSNRKTRRVSL